MEGVIPYNIWDDECTSFFHSVVTNSCASDYISVSNDSYGFLHDLWINASGEFRGLPSDIFFSKTIPLMDCVIIFGGSVSARARIVVLDCFAVLVNEVVQEKSQSVVAVVYFKYGETQVYCPIQIKFGENYCAYGIQATTEGGKKIEENKETLYEILSDFIVAWYGIQIALLHPNIKDAFKNPARCKAPNENINSPLKNRKRRAKYVRKHILTLDKLQSAEKTEVRSINRKCLAWYVIGHWRTYKSGKKVFIQPYWKGYLRNLKQNIGGDERERIIDTTPREVVME